jgi:hypothetical protein
MRSLLLALCGNQGITGSRAWPVFYTPPDDTPPRRRAIALYLLGAAPVTEQRAVRTVDRQETTATDATTRRLGGLDHR